MDHTLMEPTEMRLADLHCLNWTEKDSDYTSECFKQQLYSYADLITNEINKYEAENKKQFGSLKLFFLGSGRGIAEYCFCQLLRMLGVSIRIYFVDYTYTSPDRIQHYWDVKYLKNISEVWRYIGYIPDDHYLFIGLNFNLFTTLPRFGINKEYNEFLDQEDTLSTIRFLMEKSGHNIPHMCFTANGKCISMKMLDVFINSQKQNEEFLKKIFK